MKYCYDCFINKDKRIKNGKFRKSYWKDEEFIKKNREYHKNLRLWKKIKKLLDEYAEIENPNFKLLSYTIKQIIFNKR